MAAAEADYAPALPRFSPNYWPDRLGHAITHVVAHGTAGPMPGCLDWLTSEQSSASVHYLIARDGTIFQLVPEACAAWGNGIVDPGGLFPADPNPNLFTLSVETERSTDNSSPVTPAQQAAWVALLRDIRRRHGPLPLIPHSAIEPIDRAHCPGTAFPMAQIDAEGAFPVAYTLPHWIYMDQLTVVPDDGFPDDGARTDCGPTAVAMCLQWATGRRYNADDISDTIFGGEGKGNGYTTVQQLSSYLTTQGLTTRWTLDETAVQAANAVRRQLRAGYPTIILFYADRMAQTGGHFVVAVGIAADDSITVANPWTGTAETLSPSAWRQAYNGCVLEVHAGEHKAPGRNGNDGHFELTTDEKLRPLPVLVLPHYGPLLPKGTRVMRASAPKPLPSETTNWLWVRTNGDVRGYILKKNLRSYAP